MFAGNPDKVETQLYCDDDDEVKTQLCYDISKLLVDVDDQLGGNNPRIALIRKKVLEHLSVSPKEDTTAALVLITIAIDVERLGDYSKNFFELWELYGNRFSSHPIIEKLREVNKNIETIFNFTIDSFKNADFDLALRVMDLHIENSEICENIISDMITDELKASDLSCNQMVLLAHAARYLKRVSAHLKNIASSVVNPFDRIGFKHLTSEEPVDFGND